MDASVIEPRPKSGLDSGHGIALGLYGAQGWRFAAHTRKSVACLLYTSDAADE